MAGSTRTKSSLEKSVKGLLSVPTSSTDPLSGNWNRTLRLHVLNNIIRPARRVENSDVVGFAERHVDLTLAKLVREGLGPIGLKSATHDNTFGQLHYYDSQPGSSEPPLVMIHGIGSSGQCFALLALMLMNKRRIVLPDLFHFSGFSKPNNPVMTLKEHTQSLREFIQSLSPHSADLVGLSLGGWLSMSLSLEAPQLVRSLGLLNPGGLGFRTHSLRDTLLYLSWNKFHSLYPGIMSVYPYKGLPFLSPLLKRGVYRVLKDDSVRDFIKTVSSNDFLDKDLHRIKCPTLLMWGMQDKLLSAETPTAIVNAIPQCQGYWVRDAAHILCLEAPLNVYDCLVRFLDLQHFEDNNFVSLVRRTHRLYPMQAISTGDSEDV